MDEQLDIVSSGPRQRRGTRWHGPGRGGWIAIFAVVALLGSLVVTTRLALAVAHRDDTINSLRAALRKAGHPASAAVTPPAVSVFMLPDAGGGSFSVVAAAGRADPGSAAHTWLLVYGRNAIPGQRYGLIEDTCGGQYVAAYGVASGVADRHGDLTISAPDLAISPQAPGVWIQLYRWEDGAPLGGVQGPLTGSGAKTFRSTPPC
jgi:hypothetical protein